MRDSYMKPNIWVWHVHQRTSLNPVLLTCLFDFFLLWKSIVWIKIQSESKNINFNAFCTPSFSSLKEELASANVPFLFCSFFFTYSQRGRILWCVSYNSVHNQWLCLTGLFERHLALLWACGMVGTQSIANTQTK